jgi:hypothetical protein
MSLNLCSTDGEINHTIAEPLRFAGARTGFVEVEPELTPDGNLVVVIVSFGKGKPVHKRFAVREIPSDFGRAFRIDKQDALKKNEEPGYDVNLDGQTSACSCFDAGHGQCKHQLALQTLLHAGYFRIKDASKIG